MWFFYLHTTYTEIICMLSGFNVKFTSTQVSFFIDASNPYYMWAYELDVSLKWWNTIQPLQCHFCERNKLVCPVWIWATDNKCSALGMFAQKKYWCSTKLNMSFVAIIIGINKAIMSYYLRFLHETQNALLTSTNYDCTTDCPETSNDITPRLYFASGVEGNLEAELSPTASFCSDAVAMSRF